MANPLNPNPAPATPAQAGNAIVKTIAQGGAPAVKPGGMPGMPWLNPQAAPAPAVPTPTTPTISAPPIGGADPSQPPATKNVKALSGQALIDNLTSSAVNGLNNFHAAAAPIPTPASFAAQPMPATNPALLNPTVQTPGVNNLAQITAGAAPMMQALMNQTSEMAKSGHLTGMPNYGQLFSGLAAAQNATNNGSFTPNDQSGAAGRASEMATQGAISANTLAQRQTQEYNSEQAAAQRMNAMIMNSANEAKLRSQIGMIGQLQNLLMAPRIAASTSEK